MKLDKLNYLEIQLKQQNLFQYNVQGKIYSAHIKKFFLIERRRLPLVEEYDYVITAEPL